MGEVHQAELVFLRKLTLYQHEKPYLALLPEGAVVDASVSLDNLEFEEKDVPVLDIRGCKDAYHLEECGFEYIPHATEVEGIISDDVTVDDVAAYKKETEELLSKTFGAVKVICYDLRASIFSLYHSHCC